MSQSTVDIDREKAKIYAYAGISTFWILNLTEHKIEVYTEPNQNEYLQKRIFSNYEKVLYPSPFTEAICLSELV